MLSRILAYSFAGIPAVIGIAFVARYAYVTSDAAIDGAANAFLFGMIAAGAFAGPAVVVAVGSNGRNRAAWALAFLTVFAILANWTHTLGAIAQRGAGTEAASARAKSDEADARKELARIEKARDAIGTITPVTEEVVDAARAAVTSAERARAAECGNGDPKQRGNNCRARETAEQDKRDALAAAIANKATTDAAARLDNQAAAIRGKLAKAPAVKEGNALGEALGRLLPGLSAASAATFQQGLVSAIAELLIAAGLALPELLRRESSEGRRETGPLDGMQAGAEAGNVEPAAPEERAPSIAGVPLATPPKPTQTGSVAQFMLACLPRAQGQDVPLTAVYARYRRWCEDQSPVVSAEDASAFAAQFKTLSDRVRLRTEKRGNRVFVRDVQLVA